MAGISNYANGLIHAAQLAVGMNSTENMVSGSFQGAVLANIALDVQRGEQLALLVNIASRLATVGEQYALFNY